MPPTDGEWARVHPASPILRSWQILAVVLVFLGQDLGEGLLFDGDGGLPATLVRNRLIGVAVVLVFVVVVGLGAWLSWRRTRYRVGGAVLEFEQGLVFRSHRRAPLDRLQSIDLTEPLLARVLGLVKLTVEVAGGGDSNIEIAYLTRAEAQRLRDRVLADASGIGASSSGTPQVGRSPERAVHLVPTGRLVGSLVLSRPAILVLAVSIGAVVAASVSGEIRAGLLAIPFVLAVVVGTWSEFSRAFGFRVGVAADGVRLRRGLLEQRTQTVPPGRVQAVRLEQPLLWRAAGWWRVEVNVAGYGHRRDEAGALDTVLLPVGTIGDAFDVLGFVVEDTVVGHETAAGSGTAAGFTPAPDRARWADPVSWRRHGFRVDPTALVLRAGRFRRRIVIVPHARMQSCGIWQGPLQRRLGLASFEVHSTPGPVRPVVAHLDASVAATLLEQQTDRARRARLGARDRWLTDEVTVGPNPDDPLDPDGQPGPSGALPLQ